jgi:hypothetical protein
MDWDNLALPKPQRRQKPPPKGLQRRSNLGGGDNPYKARSLAQEDDVANRLTADTGIPYQRVYQSGADKLRPGDVRPHPRVRLLTHRWLAELKMLGVMSSRGAKRLVIEHDWLVQITREAAEERCLPALVHQHAEDSQRWVTIRYEDFARLLREHAEMTDALDGP